MSDRKPTIYYFNRCIPITIEVDTEDEEKTEVEGFFASYKPATQDSKAIICKYHYDELQSKYDELLKSSVELAEFYGDVDNWWGNGVFYYNKIDSSDESSSEDLDANSVVGGKRARDFLKKVRGNGGV